MYNPKYDVNCEHQYPDRDCSECFVRSDRSRWKTCEFCTRVFKSLVELKNHVLNGHCFNFDETPRTRDDGRQERTCKICQVTKVIVDASFPFTGEVLCDGCEKTWSTS